ETGGRSFSLPAGTRRPLSRTADRRSAGRLSASLTRLTMIGAIAAPRIAPGFHSSWMTMADTSEETLAIARVVAEIPELDRASRRDVLTYHHATSGRLAGRRGRVCMSRWTPEPPRAPRERDATASRALQRP